MRRILTVVTHAIATVIIAALISVGALVVVKIVWAIQSNKPGSAGAPPWYDPMPTERPEMVDV
jgi:hypothetical protein